MEGFSLYVFLVYVAAGLSTGIGESETRGWELSVQSTRPITKDCGEGLAETGISTAMECISGSPFS